MFVAAENPSVCSRGGPALHQVCSRSAGPRKVSIVRWHGDPSSRAEEGE